MRHLLMVMAGTVGTVGTVRKRIPDFEISVGGRNVAVNAPPGTPPAGRTPRERREWRESNVARRGYLRRVRDTGIPLEAIDNAAITMARDT